MDADALITAVEIRTPLYDKTNPDYSNRTFVKEEWRMVAKEVGCDEKEAKRRWKKLRDSFLRSHRELTAGKSGSRGRKRKKWYLYDRMQFILPHISGVQTSILPLSSDEEDGLDNDDSMSHASESSFNLPQFDTTAATVATPTPLSANYDDGNQDEAKPQVSPSPSGLEKESQQNHRQRRRRFVPQHRSSAARQSDFDTELMLKAATRLGEKNVLSTDVDEDEYFFKNLVPKIKLLNTIDKMECQAEIHMVVLKYVKKAIHSSAAEHPEMLYI